MNRLGGIASSPYFFSGFSLVEEVTVVLNLRAKLRIFAMISNFILCAESQSKRLARRFYAAGNSCLARTYGLVWNVENMIARIARSLHIHALSCVLYVVVNYCGISLYKAIFGGLTSRGASIGIAMYMVFFLFVFSNAVIAVIPRQLFKWCIVAFMDVLILAYLLPLYPVRAVAYSALTGGLTALAIVVADQFERFWLTRNLK
ncbi:hypothetical protein [Pseudomonas viridiflava]|uniref:hypothetical protein n=1 Tax=Pseudomonas viridiflava TaxID=33069 RepID=UPI001F14B7DD|nr:hypothetical protein [Pseudomonas viridiflava]